MDLMTSHTWNIVVFAIDGIILLGILLYLLRVAVFYGLFSRLRSKLRLVAEVLRSWRTEAETDELEVRLKERIQEGKLLSFKRLCQISCVLTLPITLTVMSNIAMGRPRLVSPLQDAMYFLIQGILVVISHCPEVVTWKTMDPLYIFFSVCLAVQTAPFASTPEFARGSVIIANTFLCLGSLVVRNPIVTTSMNFLVGVSAFTSIWVHRDFGSQPPRVAMTVQLFSCISIACLSHGVERSVKTMVRQRMEVEATREVLSAAIGLLRSCCDVVVELNTEGVIVSPGTDLSSFLLRGTDRCMQGCCLAELMSHEDERTTFLEKLDGPVQSGTGLAEVMHVHMKDGVGNDLQLELLLVRFHRCRDQPHYMVGLREFGDLAVFHRLQSRQASMASSMARDAGGLGNEEGPNMAESSSETIDSREEHSAVVVVDCTQPGLPIRQCSPGFCMRVGRVAPNASFTDLLVGKPDKFEAWLQLALNSLAHGQQSHPDCRMFLRMPQGKVEASCRVLGGQAREDEDEGAESIDGCLTDVRLMFYNIAQRHSSTGHRAAGSLRGTPVVHLSL